MKLAESKSFKNMTGNASFAPVIYSVQRPGGSCNGIRKGQSIALLFLFFLLFFPEICTMYFPAFLFLSVTLFKCDDCICVMCSHVCGRIGREYKISVDGIWN